MSRFKDLKRLAIMALSTLFALGAGPVWAGTLDVTTRNILHDALVLATAEYNIAGVEARITSPDGEVWYGHSGYADYATGAVFTPDTTCGIGSTTKTFTSTVLLQLVDEGKLALDDTVEQVLPGLLSVGDQITIENLLYMQSGLNHYENTSEFENQMNADSMYNWSMEQLAQLSDGLIVTPGTTFDYNNVNYMILGLMIEAKEGGNWFDAVQTRILDPLGLDSTGVMVDAAIPGQDPAAIGYRYMNGQRTDTTYYASPSTAQSSGAMCSTVDDLTTWLDAFMDGTLLSDEMQEKRFEAISTGRGSDEFGMGVGIYKSVDAVGFGGNFNGSYSSQWMRMKGWDFTVLTNGENGPVENAVNTSAAGVFRVLYKVLGL